jgi:L-ascorbate metabolism protein UlaG (beta-lactamase superfamily)
MRAHFIDVGQGDATLLEFPCGAILIDAGCDEAHGKTLAEYLKKFFKSRPDLNNTLEALFITHNHIDHTKALRSVFSEAHTTVHRYFDNGLLVGSGRNEQKWIRSQRDFPVKVWSINATNIPAHTGFTDLDVDPLGCAKCDPRILILSGRRIAKPAGWKSADFTNWNNQSVTIRVDFGETSLLFPGDSENASIRTLEEEYKDSKLLQANIYHVSHHGAENGTTAEFLNAISPKMAVISMGSWDYGKDRASLPRGANPNFTTYAYGHPRKSCVDLLAAVITQSRHPSVREYVGIKARSFTPARITKAIYATGWDGTIVLTSDLQGAVKITRHAPHVVRFREPLKGAERLNQL